MNAKANNNETKLILLTQLNTEIENAIKVENKWVTVIDEEERAEVFFKYQGTNIFSILEKEVQPENLCRSLLTMAKYPRTLTINYFDLPYKSIFDPKYFPEDVVDVDWVRKFDNIDSLRANFIQEFPEEVWTCQDFKICFLFKKNNVPDLFFEKTIVLEVCPPDQIKQRIEDRELANEASKKVIQEEKKVEETKTDPKKSTAKATSSIKAGSTSTTKSPTTKIAAKPTTGVNSTSTKQSSTTIKSSGLGTGTSPTKITNSTTVKPAVSRTNVTVKTGKK